MDERTARAHEMLVCAVEDNVLAYANFLKKYGNEPKLQKSVEERRQLLLESVRNLRSHDGVVEHITEREIRARVLDHLESSVRNKDIKGLERFSMRMGCGLKPKPRHRR